MKKLCRRTGDDGEWFDIPGHNGSGSDNCTFANGYAR